MAKPIAPPRAEAAEVIADRQSTGADAAGGGLPNIVVDPETRSPASRLSSRKQQTGAAKGSPPKAGKPMWLVASTISAAVLGVAVVAVLVYQFGGGWLMTADRQRCVLVLDWPESQRGGAAVFIDNRRLPLPRSGPAEFALKPGLHRIVMVRRGYEEVETRISLKTGNRHRLKPRWTQSAVASIEPDRSPKAAGAWLQDMEVAKRTAAAEHKDILIALEGSDSHEKWNQMWGDVLDRREFRDQMDWRFVLVRIDFPREGEAQTRTAETYRASKDSLVVLTDAEGRPYALEGSLAGGVEAFVERVALGQAARERRDSLFLNVETTQGDEKLAAVEEAAALLKRMELAHFYGPTLSGWLALVQQRDADNQKGAYEAVFEVSWLAHLAEVDGKDLKEIRRVVAELDDWKKKYKFKNPDRAAWMHLYAAARLANAEQNSEALKYLEQADQYHPKDPSLIAMLKQAGAALRGYSFGSGTGFVVAAGGCILTNYHVIEGQGKTAVRLPGRKEPLPAKVLAQDSQRDLALLKIEVPEGIELKPLHIAAAEAPRGAEIGVFGFPGGEAIGTGLKLTTGVVSAEPGQSQEKMYLLDCRVNPGNSGGPLCDNRGNVIGMVTAKIGGGFGMDSYGMALPAKDLCDFLKKHLPQYEQQQPPAPSPARLEWDEIDRIVSPSVVMIVKLP